MDKIKMKEGLITFLNQNASNGPPQQSNSNKGFTWQWFIDLYNQCVSPAPPPPLPIFMDFIQSKNSIITLKPAIKIEDLKSRLQLISGGTLVNTLEMKDSDKQLQYLSVMIAASVFPSISL